MKTTKKMIQQNFEKKISGFKCAADLQYFLMNLLSLINYNGYYCCECEKFEGPSTEWDGLEKCTFWRIPYDFNDFEKLLDINQLNSFLNSYYQRLRHYLVEFFLVNQDDPECFLNFYYEYRGHDWSTYRL